MFRPPLLNERLPLRLRPNRVLPNPELLRRVFRVALLLRNPPERPLLRNPCRFVDRRGVRFVVPTPRRWLRVKPLRFVPFSVRSDRFPLVPRRVDRSVEFRLEPMRFVEPLRNAELLRGRAMERLPLRSVRLERVENVLAERRGVERFVRVENALPERRGVERFERVENALVERRGVERVRPEFRRVDDRLRLNDRVDERWEIPLLRGVDRTLFRDRADRELLPRLRETLRRLERLLIRGLRLTLRLPPDRTERDDR